MKTRDVNSKVIFKDPLLCSQFIRHNLDIPILKTVEPEDIEDVTTQYQTYLGTEFHADSVKKIRLRNTGQEKAIFLISLIEHKSQVDYNISMQLLKYMVCIWNEYAKEAERREVGSSRSKNFRYPPIIPIVYYEGIGKWTAAKDLSSRILLNNLFCDYIPDFTYPVVRIHSYTNDVLLSREDEMSLLMMINKVQSEEDIKELLNTKSEIVNRIIQRAPERILQVIADTIWTLCKKMNLPEEEARQCVEKVRDRQMGYLFENMQKIDIQKIRREAEEQSRQAEEQSRQAEANLKKAEEIKKQVLLEKEANRKVAVQLCQRQNLSKQETISMLKNELMIEQTEATKVCEQYWKNEN